MARSGVTRSALDRGAQIVNRDSARPHSRRIRFDPNRRLRAIDIYPRHAGQDTEALAHLRACVVIELARRDGIAGQRDVHDRLIVRVAFRICRRRRKIGRQTADRLGDCRLYVGGRGINVFFESELKRESCDSLSALGSHHLEPVDLHELALERGGNVVRNRIRACSRVTHRHLDHRIINCR